MTLLRSAVLLVVLGALAVVGQASAASEQAGHRLESVPLAIGDVHTGASAIVDAVAR